MNNAIFIAATGQNVGKTTLCLGIIAALKKRFPRVGFIKPVGQQHIQIDPDTVVDKDTILFKKYFHLTNSYHDMSPVILPSGFTREYLDGKVTHEEIERKIAKAFHTISTTNDYTVVEGTGHVGVGSIVNMNNAKVASLLGLDMIIIASGGLGSAHDELALNIAMCNDYGVKIRGVILNRVLDDKRNMIFDYFPKALKHWNIPLLGCVPYSDLLSKPTMHDFEILFHTPLLSGQGHGYRHFHDNRLVAGSLEAFHAEHMPDELIITPASREDVILAVLEKHDFKGGLILTSRQPPKNQVLKAIQKSDIPVLYAPICSYDAMEMITSFTAKIRTEDSEKVEKAITLVEQNINFDLLCKP